jgi:DNA-binding MarR family transcriptional regulator
MPEDDVVAPWRWLLLAHAAALRAIEADMAERGLIPLPWYDVLLELNAAPGRRLRMTELGDRVVLSRSRVSRIVDELVGAGLVERTANPDDGRSSLARITERGRAELRRAAPHYLAGIDEHFASLLEPDERRVLAVALERVVSHHRSRSEAAADGQVTRKVK